MIVVIFITMGTAKDEFFEPKSTLGGYGELHYNYEKSEGADEGKKKLDFHRFVLFYSHAWTEQWSFKSEVELEHNFVGSGSLETDTNNAATGIHGLGELELEQAYINYHSSSLFGFKVGVLLPSVGLLNEHHEPPLFLSVERPDYAKIIIPTTWFGNGASVYGSALGLKYQFTVMEGLNGNGISNKGIRGGRQKGFKADASDFLYNASLQYHGISGLLTGVSYIYNDATVDKDNNISVNLMEAHIKYNAHNIFATAEAATIFYDSPDLKSSYGYYIDFGYNVGSLVGLTAEIIPWVRWSDYNTASETKSGGDSEKQYHDTKWSIGLALKPIAQVIFKIDYGSKTNELSNKSSSLFNIGAGYMF